MTSFRGTDIHNDNIHLEPDLSALPRVRGQDDVVPGRPGRFPRNRVLDGLIVPITGHVKGTGVDPEERKVSWRENTDTLLVLMDPSLDPGQLIITPPLMGLTGARSITGRILPGAIHGPIVGGHYQSWSFELECVDDPPEWVDGS